MFPIHSPLPNNCTVEMIYNNIQDANAALNIVKEFDAPFCVGLKHLGSCGAANRHRHCGRLDKNLQADKVSIFGSIVATNQEVTKEAAELMKPIFLEIIMAPKFSPEALEILQTKKNLRLLEVEMRKTGDKPMQYVGVNLAVCWCKTQMWKWQNFRQLCALPKTAPTEAQLTDMEFGLRIVKHVKSGTAIVVVKNGQTLGVGAGQIDRIGSAELA